MKTEHIARRSVAFFVLTSLPNSPSPRSWDRCCSPRCCTVTSPSAPTIAFSVLAWTAAGARGRLPWILHRIRFENRTGATSPNGSESW